MKPYTIQFKRQRRFLLLAPIGAVLLLTILFSSLGGGKMAEVNLPTNAKKGINVKLPSAHLPENKSLDKFAYYKKAEIDSMNYREKLKRQGGVQLPDSSVADSISATAGARDLNEEKVKRKVAELRSAMGQSMAPAPTYRTGSSPTLLAERLVSPIPSQDVDRLEQMLRVLKQGETDPNPEIRDLNKALDKLIAVQHPGMLSDTSGRTTEVAGSKPLPVSPAMTGEEVTGWKSTTNKTNRFFDLESNSGEENPEGTAIEAIVPETQTLVNGALFKLELVTELDIKGRRIPRGTLLYGVAHLSNERLQVTINTLRYRDNVYPVLLQVVDQDGLAGIYEPGSISREVVRESTAEGINGIAPLGLENSLGAQAATAGIQMVRSLATKKVKLVRVTVKAGYRVYLKDTGRI